MKAEFIGQDGSEGFVNGKEYDIETVIESKVIGKEGFLVLKDKNSKLRCPYTNMESLLDNWKLK